MIDYSNPKSFRKEETSSHPIGIPVEAPTEIPTLKPGKLSLSNTFAAMKYRNYRLWFLGQLISVIGTWMQSTAQGYLVFQLTHSPAYLGLVGFASGIPSWALMLYGGVVADRVSRRKLLIISQTSMMILAFILSALTFSNLVQPWHIVVLAFGLGVANAFDAPARQSFVLEMVERKDLSNAIAMNSTLFNSAAVVGPAIAGVSYAFLGPGNCFLLNGISFLAVIIGLALMKLKPIEKNPKNKSITEELKEGLHYTINHPAISNLMLIAGFSSLFGLAYITLIPAWAVSVLGGDAQTNGTLQAARALGALMAALMLASVGHHTPKGKWLIRGIFFSPILLMLFSFVNSLVLSFIFLAALGWSFMIIFNSANTLVQALVSDELRGRVMSIYTLTFFGCNPLGSLLAGSIAEGVGVPATMGIMGAISLIFALWCRWKRPQLRSL